ncbi:hypothetical protein GCM10017687_58370 [Streptomyces echinatus]
MHHERPVRAPLALEQPPEQGQRVGAAEPGDLTLVGAPDHEVRALAPADLLAQHPADDLAVLLVPDVEAAALHPHLVRREPVERLGERDGVRLLGRQHQQGGAVVADVEAALADLPERDEGETLLGQVGQPVTAGHRAEQHLHQLFVAAGGAAAQQGEGAGVGEQVLQVHGSGSFSIVRRNVRRMC